VDETRTPQRHPLDGFALLLGLLCLAGSGLALAAEADLFEVDGLVLLASVWLVVGVVGLARVAQRILAGDRGPS
jgi:hypothetical protein